MIQSNFERLGIVGARFREEAEAQVQAAVLARRGRDPIRLTGPSGSGKELVASLVHEVARAELGRKGKIVTVGCSHLSDAAFEPVLFGKGKSSTAAAQRGLLDEAKGGTLILDEVQSLSLQTQERLLRLVGEREYRPVGATALKRTDALLVLSSSQDLVALSANGHFRSELLDRAPAKITLPPLWLRREDIPELAQRFAAEALEDRGWSEVDGITRRAVADIEAAVVVARETSVRRLREMIRDAVFSLDAPPPVALESAAFTQVLRDFYGTGAESRDEWDRQDIEERFELALEAQMVARIARLHHLPETTLLKLARVIRELHGSLSEGENAVPSSYRNLMARTGIATKAALWLISGARNQSEFRKFFGSSPHEMPPKSVAWQIFHDVFGHEANTPASPARVDDREEMH